MDLFIYGTVREVQADQEDGTAEIILPFPQHQAPPSSGVYGLWDYGKQAFLIRRGNFVWKTSGGATGWTGPVFHWDTNFSNE